MSGSNGDHGGGGGGNGHPPESCETLVIVTQLTSPKADVVANIVEGDMLEVAIEQQDQQTVVVVRRGTEVAGGLAPLNVSRLRECLQNNYQYVAKVLSKTEGEVRVRVTLKIV